MILYVIVFAISNYKYNIGNNLNYNSILKAINFSFIICAALSIVFFIIYKIFEESFTIEDSVEDYKDFLFWVGGVFIYSCILILLPVTLITNSFNWYNKLTKNK